MNFGASPVCDLEPEVLARAASRSFRSSRCGHDQDGASGVRPRDQEERTPAAAPASHFLQFRSAPIALARPSAVVTQG